MLSVDVCVTLTVCHKLGDLVVRVGEMSLSGGGDAVVSCVDESVCCVNSVLADGILDLCGFDTVVSGVDEYTCM